MPRSIALAIACLMPLSASLAQQVPPAITELVGVWRGNSECEVSNSPCHDEQNVYRISAIAGNAGVVHVIGIKLVDGREIVMGSGDWSYDAARHVLENRTSNGTFRFVLSGGSMEGTLTLPDKTLYRRIHLKKDR